MVIRGGVYRVDFGTAKRGHEQRGKRYGIVMSPTHLNFSLMTVVPTSTRARPSLVRPSVDFDGTPTLALTDQIRTIDADYCGEMVGFLSRDQMAEVEHALAYYLGLTPNRHDSREIQPERSDR